MHLSTDDVVLYYRLLYPLQYFANQRLRLKKGIKSFEEYLELSLEEKLPVRDAVYAHPELIDEFIAENPAGFRPAELEIVAGWKRFVAGDFFIERYLKSHSIWIGDGNPPQVYAVIGVSHGLDELFHKSYLPVRIKSVLLPFKGRIIYDGLMQAYSILFGSGIKSELRETYMAAKQNGRIIEALGTPTSSRLPQSVQILPDWNAELSELSKVAGKLKAPKIPIQNEAFSLLRASVRLTQAAQDPRNLDELWKEHKNVLRALSKVETVLHRAEM